MSWFREEEPTWFQKCFINILKEGGIPNHVAIIMDGNRRFASKNCMEQVDGHSHGFERLSMALNWCRNVGIREVSVYAFSIENFKRSKEEVDRIMNLARDKFQTLVDEKEKTMKFGLCIRILGNLSLLPLDLQELVAEVMRYSKDNNRTYLNICFSYTSREEITTAVRNLAKGVERGVIKPSDISEYLFEKSLYTTKSDPPDLVIRTSGEVRLSDFMLWQSCYSVLAFVRVLWPEYSIWHLLFAIFFYQRKCKIPNVMKQQYEVRRDIDQEDDDFESAMQELFHGKAHKNPEEVRETIGEWRKAREDRQAHYLQELEKQNTEERNNVARKKGKFQ